MRRSLLFLCSVFVFLCVAPVALRAEDHGGGGSSNPLAIAFDTTVWSIIIFVALLLILRAKAWGPILEGLKKREETIRSSLEEADRKSVV